MKPSGQRMVNGNERKAVAVTKANREERGPSHRGDQRERERGEQSELGALRDAETHQRRKIPEES